MSSETRRPHREAMADAEAFRALFSIETYERWVIAGSLRRKRPDVGDVEHVVMPHHGNVPGANLFGAPELTNLLWRRVEELLAAGEIAKYVGTIKFRDGSTDQRTTWGDKQRKISFRGHLHEIYTADLNNWGSILVIRTGPGDFSERMVTRLHGTLIRQDRGYLRYEDGRIYPCQDERAFFAACREPWAEPEDRK